MVIIAQTQLVTGMIQGGLKNSPFSDVMLTPSLYKVVICMYVLGIQVETEFPLNVFLSFYVSFLQPGTKSAANILDRQVY